MDSDERKVVVFDLDDTLYLERDYVRSGFTQVDRLVRQRTDRAGFGDLAWRLFLAGRRHDIFDAALSSLGISAATVSVHDLVSCYRTHAPSIRLAPDADRALELLTLANIPMAVLTDGPTASQTEKISALGLANRVRWCVLTDQFGPGYDKPHRRGYDTVRILSRAERMCYVADNPAKDFSTPHSLGWATVRVRRAGGLNETTHTGHDVDAVIPSLDHLLPTLSDLDFVVA